MANVIKTLWWYFDGGYKFFSIDECDFAYEPFDEIHLDIIDGAASFTLLRNGVPVEALVKPANVHLEFCTEEEAEQIVRMRKEKEANTAKGGE